MTNEILNSFLKEYEQKKLKAELDLDRRKENLYNMHPRLQEIEDEINSFAIQTAKNILNNGSQNLLSFEEKIANLKKEKKEILATLNLDENYLKPNYQCKICNDTGYVTKNNYKSEMCSCLKQKLFDFSFNNSNLSNLSKENFDKFNEFIFSDEVDLSKYRYNISPRKNMLNIKEKCIEFVENFDDPKQKNLLFTGMTGLR